MKSGCYCGTVGAAPDDLRLCPDCHRYWKGDKELLSVTKILKTVWPFKPDFSRADPAVIENARDRGSVVDDLFSKYVAGQLKTLPAGTRRDAIDLFFKLKMWWDKEYGEPCGKSQVILSDDRVAGMCDLLPPDDRILDVKATYDIETMYQLQLGAYAALHFTQFQRPAKAIGILHVTKRFPEPKLVKVDMPTAIQDWMLLRDTYFMAERRTVKA